jgi:hypothetical protein
MTPSELENLVRVGQLEREPPDLAYGAAHALSLAALILRGYRCDN